MTCGDTDKLHVHIQLLENNFEPKLEKDRLIFV